jgi:glycerophosphoryl diester phosphodiesterase
MHQSPATGMFVFGHRGAAGLAPENTLRAVAAGLASGADAIEVDVRLLDGELIVLHDECLERTTTGGGHYKAMRLADLRRLDAGDGERIPLLAEVVAATAGRAGLNVEIKEPGIARAVVEFLQRQVPPDWHDEILLSSFDEATTVELAGIRGDMRLGVLYEDTFAAALDRARSLAAWSLHVPLADCTAAQVAVAHDAGLRVYVYTVNEMDDIAHCRAAGADGLFSDYPERVVAFNRRTHEVRT